MQSWKAVQRMPHVPSRYALILKFEISDAQDSQEADHLNHFTVIR